MGLTREVEVEAVALVIHIGLKPCEVNVHTYTQPTIYYLLLSSRSNRCPGISETYTPSSIGATIGCVDGRMYRYHVSWSYRVGRMLINHDSE